MTCGFWQERSGIMAQDEIMLIAQFETAIAWQANHAAEAGAPATARVIRALPKVRASDTELGHRMASWAGLALRDAMPLRVTGGLHHLALTGTDRRLVPVYTGAISDQAAVDALVLALVHDHDAALAAWLDGPPQTNEAGRSASIMAGLLWLAQRVTPRLELFELGASAGVNTMLDRYFFNLGETEAGPAGSPMRIVPEWRGGGSPPAPPPDFAITSIRGCDVAPIDLADPAAALRLKAYVWPDAPARLSRIDAAIALAAERPPEVIRQDAGDFVADCLAQPQSAGTTRAMFHSIMWQYLPAATRARIAALMAEYGGKATRARPLAWVSLETDPATFRHELTVRWWDGEDADGTPHPLAFAHPHGAWIEWTGDR
jgi:hypothetical protein